MKFGAIEDDIPVPGTDGLHGILRRMQPSQSLFVSDVKIGDLSGVSKAARRNGAKYTCRTVVENGVKGVRVWRVS